MTGFDPFRSSALYGRPLVRVATGVGTVEPRELMQRWIAELNGGDIDAVRNLLAEDYVWHLPGTIVQRDALIDRFSERYAENDGCEWTAECIVVEGNLIAARWTITGKSRETGERWTIAAVSIDRVGPTQFLEGWEIGSLGQPWGSD